MAEVACRFLRFAVPSDLGPCGPASRVSPRARLKGGARRPVRVAG